MMHGTGLLLLSAVGGYWVLERASTHTKGNLKRVGQAVGWFVVLCSILGVVCKVYSLATCSGGYCPVQKDGGKWSCPFSPKASGPASPAQ